MQMCGDLSQDLRAKYRLLVKDLRRLVLPDEAGRRHSQAWPDLSQTLRPRKADTHKGFVR
jgi:hypothetical protein